MATASPDRIPIEEYHKWYQENLMQLQCHDFSWEFEKVSLVVANHILGDLKSVLRTIIFLKENRILIDLNVENEQERFEVVENMLRHKDVPFEYGHYKYRLTMSHVGCYLDLVHLITNVVVLGEDTSVLEEDIVHHFEPTEHNMFQYLPFRPDSHSTPAKQQEGIDTLVHALNKLGHELLQQVVGKAIAKHGLQIQPSPISKPVELTQSPEVSHMDPEGMLHASQLMVQHLIEKGVLKGSIPKLDNFNGEPQTTKVSFHVWEKQVLTLEGITPLQL